MLPIKAVVVGCQDKVLSNEERDLFAQTNPLGFILFARNVESKEQIQKLCRDLRSAVGRDDAPILIDQEGGRVARLRDANEWPISPPFSVFGALYERNPAKAVEAITVNTQLQASYLGELGITVNCSPVLDLFFKDAHDIIGDRALSHDPEVVAKLGRIVCEEFLKCGITPVIKHVPGHGRALADSHLELPTVDIDKDELLKTDLYPFMQIYKDKELSKAVWSMVAHILYPQFDKTHPATTSKKVVKALLRDIMDNDGLLVADDIGMKALQGTFEENAFATVDSGNDLTLACNHSMEETRRILEATPVMDNDRLRRFKDAEKVRKQGNASHLDKQALKTRLYRLLEEENLWNLPEKKHKLA